MSHFSLFIHDHIFIFKDNTFYSNGSLPDYVLERYSKLHGKLVILARIRNDLEVKNYTPISLQNIEIIDYRFLTKGVLYEYLINSELTIVRLPSIAGIKILPLVRRFTKKYLLEVVGCAFDAFWYHSFLGKIIAPYMYLKSRYEIFNAKNVVYVTNFFLQKRYPNNKGNALACSDVGIEFPSEEIKNSKIASLQSRNHIRIGTIGNLRLPYRGHKYLIKALALIMNANYFLDIVGAGNPEKLKKLAKKLSVSDRVNFLGSLPHNEVFNWLDTIDIYVQPSLAEGLSRSLLEASARGCLCIASKVGGNVELVDAAFLFRKRNYFDLKRIILSISKDDIRDSINVSRLKYEKYNPDLLNSIRNEYYGNL